MHMEKMIRFYRRSHSIDSLMSRVHADLRKRERHEMCIAELCCPESTAGKAKKIKAGRDLREKDNNQED